MTSKKESETVVSPPYHPQFGDVVLGWFPENENPGQPGRKLRPCLVVGSCRGVGTVTVVYMTDLEHTSNQGGLEISTTDDMEVAGVEKRPESCPAEWRQSRTTAATLPRMPTKAHGSAGSHRG